MSQKRIARFGGTRTAIRPSDINEVVDALNALGNMQVVQGSANEFIYSDGNVLLSLNVNGGVGGFGSGWRWASSIEYDNSATFQSGEVVIVSPDNPTIATCTAGLWVAMQDGVDSTNKPLWSPMSPSAYWWPIAFYPSTLTVCVDGVDTEYYFNAQPVP